MFFIRILFIHILQDNIIKRFCDVKVHVQGFCSIKFDVPIRYGRAKD